MEWLRCYIDVDLLMQPLDPPRPPPGQQPKLMESLVVTTIDVDYPCLSLFFNSFSPILLYFILGVLQVCGL